MTRAAAPVQAEHLEAALGLSVGQLTRAGRKPENEDAIGIRLPEGPVLTTKGAVAVIADGVSAAEAGREASETCVTNFLSDYYSTPDAWSVRKSAQQVINSLNRWLYSRGCAFNEHQRGYVSTFSAAVFKSRQAHLFHVGDSRIYQLRDGQLEQLTRDHAVPVSEGQTYLTRAMGLDLKLSVDYQTVELQVGDLFLLTTDGVHDSLSHDHMRQLLSQSNASLEAVCESLVSDAEAAGSTDNLSCQVLRVDRLPNRAVDDVVESLTRLAFPPFLEPGMVLDGYRILRELHASNRSQVYQVEDVASGEYFCMKTPSVNFEDDPAYIERFVMESWIGSRIHNSHVVRVVEPPREKTCLYYLTDYVDGMTLKQWMKEHPRPAVEEVVYLVEQIGRGLRAFHRRETLHQDIKPDNVLIDRNGVVKIIDFGSCHVAGIAEIATPLVRDIPLGTRSYAAPEYTVGKQAGPTAEVFSLAVLSYEMLTGQLPFGGKLERCRTPADFLNTRYTPAFQINPLVPVWIDGALRKGLRYLPERRHQDIAEFLHELQHPNPAYLEYRQRPLLERDPVRAWQWIAGVLALSQLATLAYFLS